jgi:hypothetical protein
VTVVTIKIVVIWWIMAQLQYKLYVLRFLKHTQFILVTDLIKASELHNKTPFREWHSYTTAHNKANLFSRSIYRTFFIIYMKVAPDLRQQSLTSTQGQRDNYLTFSIILTRCFPFWLFFC